MDTEQDVVVVHTGSNDSTNATCPHWFVHSKDTNSSTCMCGSELGGVVKCNSSLQELFILNAYCVTHDKYLGAVVGSCIYNQWYIAGKMHSAINYHLPHNISELNGVKCVDI